MSEDPRYRLIFDESKRALDFQSNTLNDARTRASALLAAAAIAAGFLGAESLKSNRALTVWTVLASACFIGVGWAAVYVLAPRSPTATNDTLENGWRFINSPRKLFQTYVMWLDVDVDKMLKELALHLEDNFRHNRVTLDKLMRALQVAAGLLVLEVVFFFIELLSR